MLQATHGRWLREQLPQLVAAGVLDAATAERLRAHYDAEAQGRGTRVVRGPPLSARSSSAAA